MGRRSRAALVALDLAAVNDAAARDMEAVAGLPAPPAGTVEVVVALQGVVVPVLKLVSVIDVLAKTGLPAASWT